MAASRILLVEADAADRQAIEAPLTSAGHTVTVVEDRAAALAQAPDNQLVIIDRLAPGAGLDLCRDIRATPALASVPVLCVADADDVDTRIAFLEAGADDVVARPFDGRELEIRVEALLLRFQRSRELAPTLSAVPGIMSASRRRTVVVFGPKGGAGSTTIAVNVALAKARTAPDKVVIVDLDLQFGQVATFLDVTPRQTLADVVRDEQAVREAELLRTYATRHDSGLHVIAAPGSPELASLVESSHVELLVRTILGTYDFVVIDAGSTVDERTMTAFEAADTLVLPVYPDMAALKALHALVDHLNESGSMATKATYVLNNMFAREILKLRDVESALGTKVALELPYDPFIYLKAVNEGRPVVQGAPRSLAAERLSRLSSIVFDEVSLVGAAPPARAEASRNGRRGPRFAFRRR